VALPVVTVAAGGLPVVDVTAASPRLGLGVTEAANGRGMAVTKVIAPKPGLAVTYVADAGAVAADPSFPNVGALAEFDGIHGQNSGYSEVKGKAATFSGTAMLSNAKKRFALQTTSLFAGTGGIQFADSADWDLADSNSDQYTIEVSGNQVIALVTNWDLLGQFGGAGSYAWLMRWQASGEMVFYWSSDGSALQSFNTTAGGATALDTWYDFCVEKNSAGKIRIYFNGVMKGSNTPANSAIFNAGAPLQVFNHGGAPPSGYVAHLRITKGVARYNSDAGYTPSTGPYPVV